MDRLKHGCDVIAACGALITIVGWLPTVLGAIASALSIAWYCLRFYEWYKGRKLGD